MITSGAARLKVMDSDLHTIEPPDLWDRYLDEPFKKLIPTLNADPSFLRNRGRPRV